MIAWQANIDSPKDIRMVAFSFSGLSVQVYWDTTRPRVNVDLEVSSSRVQGSRTDNNYYKTLQAASLQDLSVA